jgi:hypothetical protein
MWRIVIVVLLLLASTYSLAFAAESEKGPRRAPEVPRDAVVL